MNITLIEPFMTGSHAAWARQYQACSENNVRILSLEGKYWKWRMHGGAVSLAQQFMALGERPDLLLLTDMLDVTTFLSLTRRLTHDIPVALYFHENQLSYPWSPDDRDPALKRDMHYGFINYASALSADALLFNSTFHQRDFLKRLPEFLTTFPDHNELETVDLIAAKCSTLHLGLDLKRFDKHKPQDETAAEKPLLLWNHRWEYDKNPEDFFQALFTLQERGINFDLAVLGESYAKQPKIFSEARERLQEQIVHWGFASSFAEYARWLWRADILPVTSIHDFFGISVVEAIYCGCQPLLPNRLAYPEHIPDVLKGVCFYADQGEFTRRLTELCACDPPSRDGRLQERVSGYDWGVVGAVYDRLFERLARC